MVQYGTVWYSMVQYGIAWYSMVQYGLQMFTVCTVQCKTTRRKEIVRVCELQRAPRSICWATHWSENHWCLRRRPETGTWEGQEDSGRGFLAAALGKRVPSNGLPVGIAEKHISVVMILAEHSLFVKSIGNKLECYSRWWTKGRGWSCTTVRRKMKRQQKGRNGQDKRGVTVCVEELCYLGV